MAFRRDVTESEMGDKAKPNRDAVKVFAMTFVRQIPALAAMFLVSASSAIAQQGPGATASPLAPGASSPLRANLNITPKRMAFKRGARSGTVYIYNQGSTPAVFDITMVDRIMLPSGEILPASQAEDRPELRPILARTKSAKPFVIATPRRAMLLPGKGQLVRIRVTAPPSADAAEYRTHLTVITVPPRGTGLTAEAAAAATSSDRLSFDITSLFGISIPIIVRATNPDLKMSIINPQIGSLNTGIGGTSPKQAALSLKLRRQGANSLFGNVEVRSRSGGVLLGLARGVGVYTEIDDRQLSVPLQRVPVRGETLDITFVDDDVYPGRVISRTTLIVP